MAERKRIALIFSYNENWIGGTYYILNLVHALNILPDEQKPEIMLCTHTKKEFEYFAGETKYPYLRLFEMNNKRIQLSFMERLINKIVGQLFKKQLYSRRIRNNQLQDEFDMVFPNPDGSFFELIDRKKKIYWIPDFQEDYLPEYFSREEIVFRKQNQIAIALLADKLIFSSHDAQNDFNRLYPFATCKQYILPFAVTLPDYTYIDIRKLKQKFNIKVDYFYAPNQFWAHKNHKIIIEAVECLKNRGIEITVIFSGKEHDYRNLNYVDELKKIIQEKSIEKNIIFLGFIDRKEQLCLMKNAIAIIQPSRFEGWSTVIEDAKAMNQFVIASNLKVHQEQLKQNVFFFNPEDKNSLINMILKILNENIETCDNNYMEAVKRFAEDFIDII